MTSYVVLLACALALAVLPSRATTFTAIRPGVMCASAGALAQLTLPDGSSRSARSDASPADLAEKRAGGCIDIPVGAKLVVLAVRKNTSIVTYGPGNGQGTRTYVAPNVDLAAAGVPGSAAPRWGDWNYPPLIAAAELLDAVNARCPKQGWTEHLLSHTEGPWDAVADRLPRAQQDALNREAGEQCQVGLSCPADIAFGMEVRFGHLRELVDAICSRKAPSEWVPELSQRGK